MKPAADPLVQANAALREALRRFEAPSAKLLPPAEYSALERQVMHLSRLVEGMLLGPHRNADRWGNGSGGAASGQARD